MQIKIEAMTPQDVAQAFCVDVRTVTRWAKTGKLDFFQTVGGHRRYYAAQVQAILTGSPVPSVASIRGAK